MISIKRADKNHNHLLSEIARLTFIESHGTSAKQEIINDYIAEKYNLDVFKTELTSEKNNYHLIYYQNRLAGFSNLLYNFPYENSKIKNIAKLERIYILKEFYDLKLGLNLFEFNVNLAKENNQRGIWLYVWKDNERAIDASIIGLKLYSPRFK